VTDVAIVLATNLSIDFLKLVVILTVFVRPLDQVVEDALQVQNTETGSLHFVIGDVLRLLTRIAKA